MLHLIKKVLLVTFTTYILFGFVIIPYLVQSYTPKVLKEFLNADGHMGSIFLNPFTCEIEIHNFLLKDNKGDVLLFFKSLSIDIDPMKIIDGEIVIKDFEIENSQINISKDKNEEFNFDYILKYLAKNAQPKSVEKEEKPLSLIFVLEHFKLSKTLVSFKDFSKKTPFIVRTKSIHIELKDIKTKPNHINKIALNIATDSLGQVTFYSDVVLSPLSAKGSLELQDIGVNKIFHYVKTADMKFDVDSTPLMFTLRYDFNEKNEQKYIVLNDTNLDIKQFQFLQDNYDVTISDFHHKIKQIDAVVAKDTTYTLSSIDTQMQKIRFKDGVTVLNFKEFKNFVEQVTQDTTQAINITNSLDTPSKGKITTNLSVIQKPFSVDVKFNMDRVDIKPYQPYIQQFANIKIKSTYLSVESNTHFLNENNQTKIVAKANIGIEDIDVYNKVTDEQLLEMKRLDVNNLRYKNDDLYIQNITLDMPYITYLKQSKKFDTIAVKKSTKTDRTKEKTTKSNFKYLVDSFVVKDANMIYSDNTIDKDITLSFLNTQVDNITSVNDAITKFQLTSILDEYAFIISDANFTMVTPFEKTKFKSEILNVDLPSLSPYSARYIGSNTSNGKLNIVLDYTIKKAKIKSTNNVSIDDMELGEGVESEDAIKAPVGLAIALLKDSDDKILLNVPITGDINNPDFYLGDVIRRSITNILLNIVSAPFKFLGSLAGLDGEDMSKVIFAFGSNKLTKEQKQKLDTLVKVLVKRPNLSLSIQPSYATKEDGVTLDKKLSKEQHKVLLETLAKQRALAIRNYVLLKKLPASRVEIKKEIVTTSAIIEFEVDVK